MQAFRTSPPPEHLQHSLEGQHLSRKNCSQGKSPWETPSSFQLVAANPRTFVLPLLLLRAGGGTGPVPSPSNHRHHSSSRLSSWCRGPTKPRATNGVCNLPHWEKCKRTWQSSRVPQHYALGGSYKIKGGQGPVLQLGATLVVKLCARVHCYCFLVKPRPWEKAARALHDRRASSERKAGFST